MAIVKVQLSRLKNVSILESYSVHSSEFIVRGVQVLESLIMKYESLVGVNQELRTPSGARKNHEPWLWILAFNVPMKYYVK